MNNFESSVPFSKYQFKMCCGLMQPTTKSHTAALSLLWQWDGDRIRRVKARELGRWDKDSLTAKAKAAHSSKSEQGIHSSLCMGRQLFNHPPGMQDSISYSSYLGTQMPSLWWSHPSSFFLFQLYMLSMMPYGTLCYLLWRKLTPLQAKWTQNEIWLNM